MIICAATNNGGKLKELRRILAEIRLPDTGHIPVINKEVSAPIDPDGDHGISPTIQMLKNRGRRAEGNGTLFSLAPKKKGYSLFHTITSTAII